FSLRLWDPLVRLFHVSIAGVFVANYFFNEAGGDWHIWLGYYAVAWLAVRVVVGIHWAAQRTLERFLATSGAPACAHALADRPAADPSARPFPARRAGHGTHDGAD
ncbi:cytochrome B561, partial [Pseudomonas syringae pv. pisi str. 1704B]